MNRLFVLAIASPAALVPFSAQAADIIVPPPVVEYVEPVKPDYSAWYIRADAIYIFETETSADYLIYDSGEFIDHFHHDGFRLEDAFGVGVGAGYRVTEHFRADATVDYFKTDIRGSSGCEVYNRGRFGTPCEYRDSSEADIWTVMANAYVDLPYFGPFTPYFGAGLGFAHVSYGELKNVVEVAGEPVQTWHHDGVDTWRFASSLMAGATFDITKSLKLDAGYRYTRIHEDDAFGFDEEDRAAGASGVQTRDDGFDIHALRAGLRYEFY